jgi:hypothetical protein
MTRMQRIWIAGLALALLATAAVAQDEPSLGDVARKQRHEHEKDAHSPKKVITNDQIPSRPPSAEESSSAAGEESSLKNTPALERQDSAEHWKHVIQEQKEAIASNQKRLDEFKASIHFVEANRYSNGVRYNEEQLRRQKEAERGEKQLEEQKKKLADMQEAARRQGFGSAVYDP